MINISFVLESLPDLSGEMLIAEECVRRIAKASHAKERRVKLQCELFMQSNLLLRWY